MLTKGCCREEQQQPVFMAIDALEFPELHDESIPYMAFVKNCAKLLSAAGVRDFSMQVLLRWQSGGCVTAPAHPRYPVAMSESTGCLHATIWYASRVQPHTGFAFAFRTSASRTRRGCAAT